HHILTNSYNGLLTNRLPPIILWKYTFSHITFDSCPSIQGKADLLEANQLNDALLKGMSDSQGEFVGYFIKNDELKYKTTTDTLAYEIVREYNWSIQNTALGATEDIYSWRIDKDSGKFCFLDSHKLLLKYWSKYFIRIDQL
ncbi:hypothetical protein HZS_7993, partial [Henneguya salminicola]